MNIRITILIVVLAFIAFDILARGCWSIYNSNHRALFHDNILPFKWKGKK